MCGIAGRTLNRPGRIGADLTAMMAAQRHRGWDSTGFALYGEPLAAAYGKRAAPSLNELIRYGEEQAIVSLTLSIGAKELSITRTIERDKGQRISLDVRQLGMPPEKTITSLNAANGDAFHYPLTFPIIRG